MSTLTPMTQLSKRLDAFEIELAGRPRKPQTKLYASSFMDCGRQHAYKLLGYEQTNPEEVVPAYKRSAAYGEAIHGVIQQRLIDAGMIAMLPNFDYDDKVRTSARSKGELSPAIEVPLNEWTLTSEKFQEFKRYNLGGRIDGILQGKAGQIILEIKTIAHKYFQPNYRQYYNQKLYHFEEQASMYMHFWGAEKGIILVVDREDSTFQEFMIDYDPDYIIPALERLGHLNATIMKAELPEPEPSRGPCAWCQFRDLCPASEKDKSGKK